MELLTGECKNKFEEWYVITYLKHSEKYFTRNKYYVDIDIRGFYNTKQLSEQYGVLVDFFDSEGIDVGAVRNIECTFNSWCSFYEVFDITKRALPTKGTRPGARKQAIQKANELFNNK